MSMETENVNVNEEVQEEVKEFTSEVKIAGDVIATIAGLAATEIEGIASTDRIRPRRMLADRDEEVFQIFLHPILLPLRAHNQSKLRYFA